jgi:hypothetical protein
MEEDGGDRETIWDVDDAYKFFGVVNTDFNVITFTMIQRRTWLSI